MTMGGGTAVEVEVEVGVGVVEVGVDGWGVHKVGVRRVHRRLAQYSPELRIEYLLDGGLMIEGANINCTS